MKIRNYIVLFLLSAVCCSSCDKNDTPIFEMDVFFDINIPAGLNTIENHYFIIEDVPTFASALLSSNNLSPEDIGSILGGIGTVETRFSGLDLDFIQDVGVHLLDQENQLSRNEAFYIFNDYVQLGTKTEIEMIPSILNLQDLLLEETVDIEFRINLRNFLPQELDGRIQMKFLAYSPE